MTAMAVNTVSRSSLFGRTKGGKGENVYEYTLDNGRISASFISLGACVRTLFAPDARGDMADVVLGFDDVSSYESNPAYIGACVGRVANRIGNGRFTLGGSEYSLTQNEGTTTLHGGNGISRRVWDAEALDNGVRFHIDMQDGEDGFPGAVAMSVTYKLSGSSLIIEYAAKATADTPFSPTNHCYFNLSGEGSIRSHELLIHANRYTPTDEKLIPDGRLLPVFGTPLDFTARHSLGERMDAPSLKATNGYDHNYMLDDPFAAVLRAPDSGRRMEVYTDMGSIQLYTSGGLCQTAGKYGAVYGAHSGVCLETQFCPDSVNKPNFPQCILKAGAPFFSRTEYRFI